MREVPVRSLLQRTAAHLAQRARKCVMYLRTHGASVSAERASFSAQPHGGGVEPEIQQRARKRGDGERQVRGMTRTRGPPPARGCPPWQRIRRGRTGGAGRRCAPRARPRTAQGPGPPRTHPLSGWSATHAEETGLSVLFIQAAVEILRSATRRRMVVQHASRV